MTNYWMIEIHQAGIDVICHIGYVTEEEASAYVDEYMKDKSTTGGYSAMSVDELKTLRLQIDIALQQAI